MTFIKKTPIFGYWHVHRSTIIASKINSFHNSLACHKPVLDRSNQHFQASVHFTLTSAVDKSQQHQNTFLGMPRIKPGATSWEVRMLPLCFATHPPPPAW